MSGTVLLRAASGPDVGLGHAMRARAVALAVREAGGRAVVIVDEERTRAFLSARASSGLEVERADAEESWSGCTVRGAWVDGFRDWSAELARLRAADTPAFLVENRTGRELAGHVVYPALHFSPDPWDGEHAERVLAGPSWIPLSPEVLAQPPGAERDVACLVTFGGSDPSGLTERVVRALRGSAGRVVISVGAHMRERRAELESLAGGLSGASGATVLEPGAPLAPWMARSRGAVTALGTTLYELAYLGVPALILANHESDREALEHYAEHGPHRPLGIASELEDEELRQGIRSGLRALATGGPRGNGGPGSPDGTIRVPGLGGGARRLARRLLGERADP